MSRTSKFFGTELSRQASKTAVDAFWAQKDGARAYNLGGKILAGCGIGWILISFIPIACKTPISECIWLWVIAGLHIILGTVLVVLSKKSERFQKWAEKDFKKGLKSKEKLEGKVTIGKRTLPLTHGDVLAFKILGVIVIILIVIMGIGTLQGWVVW